MRKLAFAIVLCALTVPVAGRVQAPGAPAQRTLGLSRADGFIPFYLDPAKGKILFEIPRLGEDVLYYV